MIGQKSYFNRFLFNVTAALKTALKESKVECCKWVYTRFRGQNFFCFLFISIATVNDIELKTALCNWFSSVLTEIKRVVIKELKES